MRSLHPRASAEERLLAAQHYAYRIGLHLNHNSYRDEFEKKFKPSKPLAHEKLPPQPAAFLVTESRQAVSQQLDDLLALRELRQKGENDAQKYGGLGGIVLEGEPGLGKSELVIARLLARGYSENHDLSGPPQINLAKPHFYRMPVSMQYSDKEALLIKAFHEGAVVVIDEINSSPMMERLLNALLMGKNPLGKTPAEQVPKKPGFLIIGTQNPALMDGRLVTSTALARRLITVPLPTYTKAEMQTILVQKEVAALDASKIIAVFEKNSIKAHQENLKPAPTFRDVIREADRYLTTKAKQKTAPIIVHSTTRSAVNSFIDFTSTIGKKLFSGRFFSNEIAPSNALAEKKQLEIYPSRPEAAAVILKSR